MVKELAQAKASVTLLEKSIAKKLATLHSEYGFGSMEEFIVAVKAAAHGRKSGPSVQKPRARRKRAKITKETHARVKTLVNAGKTGAEIAAALKISLPSVQNIKKSLGLVKISRNSVPKKKASRAKTKRKSKPRTGGKSIGRPVAPDSKPAETTATPSEESSK